MTVIENGANRRADVVVYVNGLPLGVAELKNPGDGNATLDGAWNQLQTYKAQIPLLFRGNAALVISDGLAARIGSLTANRERFVVVIADEAHRSQYGFEARVERRTGEVSYGFARRLRDALPNASFIGFTGTPVETADVSTLAVFGGFTEGMQLFASFAMLMNFPRFNKMKGMGQIVTWSIRDESLHCEGMVKLFHAFCAETNVMTDELREKIRDCCRTVIALEDKFIDLAFEMGPVEGMTPADIKSYIRYIADWRLGQLKLEPIYGIDKHPLPWLSEILNGVEHANFFEQRATEYSKGATKGDWHGDEGVWGRFDERSRKAAATPAQ